jgi:hypothetical protein
VINQRDLSRLAYLGRYTHRVAISNNRLVSIEGGQVRFGWKDYRQAGRGQVMTLSASEFLRRFLLHVLPKGLHRIRQYGLLSNRGRAEKLAACRRLLGVTRPAGPPPQRRQADELFEAVTGQPANRRPVCGSGRMKRTHRLEPAPSPPVAPRPSREPRLEDSS